MKHRWFAGLLLAFVTHALAVEFTAAERRAILRHGPWPPAWTPDPSNRVSGKPEAIALGEKLFFEPRLSAKGGVLCATCHVPYRGWQDGRARGMGHVEVDRNTQSLLDVRWNRWFGWDGAGDSLWAQSIRPMLDPREMGASAVHAAGFVRSDAEYVCHYRKTFGSSPPADDEALLVDIGKALAAFQETLLSGRTPFDDFRDALERSDVAAAASYPVAAQRGLKIFIGKGNCHLCHVGPTFSNGEFHDTGVSHFIRRGEVDAGRHGGIQRLKASPFNLLSRYNDDRSGTAAIKTKHVAPDHRNYGEFKVPRLRNVALTAPYMHSGRLATLTEVVRHYSDLNLDRLHADGESILKPLKLSEQEIADLVAFLESLTERRSAIPERRPVTPCLDASAAPRSR
jgi:cytochrome c peroxidase